MWSLKTPILIKILITRYSLRLSSKGKLRKPLDCRSRLVATLMLLLVGNMAVSVYDGVVDTHLEYVAHNIVFFGTDYLKFVH